MSYDIVIEHVRAMHSFRVGTDRIQLHPIRSCATSVVGVWSFFKISDNNLNTT